MGKPGNKEQSSISNIFKRVPNYNYEKQGSEAIVPNIGGMGEQSSENVYMSDAEKSPLQQAGFSPLNLMGAFIPKEKPDAGITGAMGSDLRRQQYDDKGWAYDDTIAGDHKGAYTAKKENKPTATTSTIENAKKNLPSGTYGFGVLRGPK